MAEKPIVEISELKKYYRIKTGRKSAQVFALDGVSFAVQRGETLGLVGESGCGKTTLGRTLLRLQEPTSGRIFLDGEDITHVEMRPYRRKMQIIFQDPIGSLDPRMRICDSVEEALRAGGIGGNRAERREKVIELLGKVGLNSEHATRYPHEFSGGQRQCIGIARALAVSPEFVVCDEPVSALDVSYQSQIVNLLEELQEQLDLTYLFIAHDLSVVRHMSDRIAIMYLGKMVEIGSSREIAQSPAHPYSRSLLSSVPIPDPRLARQRQTEPLMGELPSPVAPPPGCRFHTRCRYAMPQCSQSEPEMKEVAPGHLCACHLV